MNKKQLLLIILAGAILGAAGLVMYKKEQNSWNQTARPREKLITDFPLNDVAKITVKGGSGELNLVKQDDLWCVQEREGFAANYSDIKEFLQKMWELKGGQPVEVSQSQLSRLELLPPGKGASAGTQVEFKDKSGKLLHTLLLGKKHMKKSPGGMGGMGGGEWPDGRYVMVNGETASVSLLTEAFSNLEPKPEQWLSKDLIKVEKVKAITLVSTNATNSWKVTRETEAGEWKLADAGKDEQIDSVKVSSASTALSSASLTDVVAATTKAETTGLDKPTVITLETFDGFTYVLKFGNKTSDDNGYYTSFTVAANLPKERTPGKDEKKEDKDRLDKEFKDNLKKSEEKLQKEKSLEKWNYVVAKWTVESLFKPRPEMLAPKKEEPKPEEKKDDKK
ncbi:MAG: DUF4340 domain-containing protein [Verrucomicrobiota bacterium]